MSDTRAIAQKFIKHIEAGEFLDAFGLLAEDGKYTVIGTTKASGVYNGRQDLFDRLIPLLGAFVVPPKLEFEEPIIDGDRAVILAKGSGQGPTGAYDQPYYAFVTRVKDGGFSEVTEFMDTMMLETAVFGKQLVDA